MPTETDKQRALEAIQALPDGAAIDDAIERLCFIAKIEEGFAAIAGGAGRQSRRGQEALSRVDDPAVDRARSGRPGRDLRIH
jgi:hypothetical protein